jgi:hypothetical protein
MFRISIPLVLGTIAIMSITTTFTPLTTMMIVANAQQGEVQVESEGDLEATLNGESFTTGDTITISGTVEDRAIGSSMGIDVIDPQSTTIIEASPPLTADDTFTFSFQAGVEEDTAEILEPMELSGNYRVVVSYYENSGDSDINEVEFAFEYTPAQQGGVSPGPLGSEQVPEGLGTGGAAIGITPQEASPLQSLPSPMHQASHVGGIRVQVPDGWVVDDSFNGTDALSEQTVREHGGKYLGALCPQNQALPGTGEYRTCQFQSPTGADEGIVFYSFPNLQTRPEFEPLVRENRPITMTDLIGLYFDLNRELHVLFPPYIEIVSNTDIAVNVFDPQTNQTIGRVPAKYVEFTQTYPDDPDASYTEFVLLALNNDNATTTGYAVRPTLPAGQEDSREVPSFVRQVFDSFELLAPATTVAPTGTPPQTPPAVPQPLQQQEQQVSPSPFSQQLQLQQDLTP